MSTNNDTTDKRVKTLYDSGLGRNAIARRLNVTQHVVDASAKRQGLEFDRTRTAIAVRARQIMAAEERQELADKMRRLAKLQLESAFNDMLKPSELKDRAIVMGILVQRELDIARYDNEANQAANIEQEAAQDQFAQMLQAAALGAELQAEQDQDEEETE